jgi:hypothetical protein
MAGATEPVPIPFIYQITVPKRLAYDRNDDRMASADVIFYPPNKTREWPRTVGDIKDTEMKFWLKWCGGVGAIGSTTFSPSNASVTDLRYAVLADGVIYTDDSLFWFSKISDHSNHHFAYRTSCPFKPRLHY